MYTGQPDFKIVPANEQRLRAVRRCGSRATNIVTRFAQALITVFIAQSTHTIAASLQQQHTWHRVLTSGLTMPPTSVGHSLFFPGAMLAA